MLMEPSSPCWVNDDDLKGIRGHLIAKICCCEAGNNIQWQYQLLASFRFSKLLSEFYLPSTPNTYEGLLVGKGRRACFVKVNDSLCPVCPFVFLNTAPLPTFFSHPFLCRLLLFGARPNLCSYHHTCLMAPEVFSSFTHLCSREF